MMDINTKVNLIVGSITAVLGLLFLGLFAASCISSMERTEATDLGALTHPEEDVGVGIVGAQGGSVPLGFYERQCQWDAPCGNPPYQQLKPQSDPGPQDDGRR